MDPWCHEALWSQHHRIQAQGWWLGCSGQKKKTRDRCILFIYCILGHLCGFPDWNYWSKCGFPKTRHCGRFLVCFTLLYTLFPPYNTCLFAAVVLISLVLWDLVVEKVAESIREREDNIMLPTFKLFSTEQDTDQLTTLVWLHMF